MDQMISETNEIIQNKFKYIFQSDMNRSVMIRAGACASDKTKIAFTKDNMDSFDYQDKLVNNFVPLKIDITHKKLILKENTALITSCPTESLCNFYEIFTLKSRFELHRKNVWQCSTQDI